MDDLKIFSVGSQKMSWLAARSVKVASNIANADTPGFRAKDVVPFESYMEQAPTGLVATNIRHMTDESLSSGRFAEREVEIATGKHSGNSVSLEMELAKAGEIRSQHNVATNVIGAFHRMLLSSSKG